MNSFDRVWGAQLRATVTGILFHTPPVFLRATIEDGHLRIEFSGDNVYLKESPVLSPDPANYTTIAGPLSSGIFDAGPAAGQRYFLLGDIP